MSIYKTVLAEAVKFAQIQKHGHMTLKDIQWQCLKTYEYSHKQIKNAVRAMRKNNMFRPQVKYTFRNSCVIRELREDLWNPPPETEINSVRYQLKQANKHLDALKIKYENAVLRANENYLMLSDIRKTWRRFQDLMTERR